VRLGDVFPRLALEGMAKEGGPGRDAKALMPTLERVELIGRGDLEQQEAANAAAGRRHDEAHEPRLTRDDELVHDLFALAEGRRDRARALALAHLHRGRFERSERDAQEGRMPAVIEGHEREPRDAARGRGELREQALVGRGVRVRGRRQREPHRRVLVALLAQRTLVLGAPMDLGPELWNS
jgi:hypothetical protein